MAIESEDRFEWDCRQSRNSSPQTSSSRMEPEIYRSFASPRPRGWDAKAGSLTYEDLNFPDRSGWKEIVIAAGNGATLTKASQTSTDLSKALTDYPPDPTLAPPQDLRAELTWTVEPQLITKKNTPAPAVVPVQQPHKAPAASSPATMTAQGAQPGTLVRGDFLSRLLQHKELTLSMMLLALAISFGLGGLHALTPGHGKTIVAAYLVGARGTLKHAAFLGAMVTFTHTISVFALGLATLFLFRYIVPEKITQTLGVISGLSIVAIGGWMLLKRFRGSRGHSHTHSHWRTDTIITITVILTTTPTGRTATLTFPKRSLSEAL